jgi:hypothetical protein
MKRIVDFSGVAVVFLTIIALTAGTFSLQGLPAVQSQEPNSRQDKGGFPPDFMGIAGISGWILSGNPRTFLKDGLPGYLHGGTDIYLQYGFRNLSVFDLVPENRAGAAKKTIRLEIYKMDSPASAFGIFSVKRQGGEPTSAKIKALHWVEPNRANMVLGDYYVNILATGCTMAEVEDFASSLAGNLPPKETSLPGGFSCMPQFDLVSGTERYICGEAAAESESPLLGEDFWGFKGNATVAYSAEYSPGPSKVIVLKFKNPPDDLRERVYSLFTKYFLDVTTLDQVVQGRTVIGRHFYFGWNGPNGVIIQDEPDPRVARKRIREALDKAAKEAGAKPGKIPFDKKRRTALPRDV